MLPVFRQFKLQRYLQFDQNTFTETWYVAKYQTDNCYSRHYFQNLQQI